jgi:hypothetical protein
MKSYRVMKVGNRIGAKPGARFQLDVQSLSESEREKHATDLRLGRVALVMFEGTPEQVIAGGVKFDDDWSGLVKWG